MCYTGICPYENGTGGNEHIGECTLTGIKLEAYPSDAGCIEAFKESEEVEYGNTSINTR